MDEIILICDHSNTILKRKNLLDLIMVLKKKYKVALVSHINLSSDIVDCLDYYFYHENNNLNYDYDLKPYKFFKSGDINIKFKPFKMFSTHIFAILEMLGSAMCYLKSCGYDIVHVVEYDLKVKSLDIFEKNKKELKTYDFFGYKKFFYPENGDEFYTHCGELFSLRLDKIDYSLLNFSKKQYNNLKTKLLDLYEDKKHTVAELLFYEVFIKKVKHKLVDREILNNSVIANLENSGINNSIHSLENNLVFILDKEKLKILGICLQENKNRMVTLIVDNNKVITYHIEKHTWFLKSTNISHFNLIKVYIDDKFLTEISMESPYIVKLKKNEI